MSAGREVTRAEHLDVLESPAFGTACSASSRFRPVRARGDACPSCCIAHLRDRVTLTGESASSAASYVVPAALAIAPATPHDPFFRVEWDVHADRPRRVVDRPDERRREISSGVLATMSLPIVPFAGNLLSTDAGQEYRRRNQRPASQIGSRTQIVAAPAVASSQCPNPCGGNRCASALPARRSKNRVRRCDGRSPSPATR